MISWNNSMSEIDDVDARAKVMMIDEDHVVVRNDQYHFDQVMPNNG